MNSSKPKAYSSWHLFFLYAKSVISVLPTSCCCLYSSRLPIHPNLCVSVSSWWASFCSLSYSSASESLYLQNLHLYEELPTLPVINRKRLMNTGYWHILSRKDVHCYAQMALQNRNLGSMLSRYVSQGSAEKKNQWDIWSDLLWRICSPNYGC